MNAEFDLEERSKGNTQELANSIKMQWNSPKFDGKILLLVENETDKLCYFKLFDTKHVEIRTTCGCNRMKCLFDDIQPTGIPNFAIQDSDFARVCGNKPDAPNYFFTDKHDHEMMCLADDEVMKDLFENKALPYDVALVDEVFDDLLMLSQLKWYNYYRHLNVNFKGFKVRGKNKEDLHSFSAIYESVRLNSPNCIEQITEEDLRTFVDGQPPQDRYELTNGHDFLDILSQHIGQRCHKKNLKQDDLRPIIYALFTKERFARTQLFRSISVWAGNKYKVFDQQLLS